MNIFFYFIFDYMDKLLFDKLRTDRWKVVYTLRA